MKLEYWVKNNTGTDLVSSELKLKIQRGRPANLCALNPDLTHESLHKSEEEGFLRRCFDTGKLIKLPFAPAKPTYTVQQKAKKPQPIPSRVKTAVVMDSSHQDFIEELSHFEAETDGDRYTDGFVDVLSDNVEATLPDVAIGEDRVGNTEVFQAVVIRPASDVASNNVVKGAETKPITRKLGSNREVVMDIDE